MSWKKIGKIFVAAGEHNWMASHAANPKAVHLFGDVFRVFVGVRDKSNRSHIGFVDIDLARPRDLLNISSKPVLEPGEPGLFDDSGVLPACVVDLAGGAAIYYIGISRSSPVPFASFPGVALLDKDLLRATRLSRAPVLGRSEHEPFSGGGLEVLRNPTSGGYEMWYESCNGWSKSESGWESQNYIRHAQSPDGLSWNRTGTLCVPSQVGNEYIATPSVLRDGDKYRMWYSFKVQGKYSIGYAESLNGVVWDRKDELVGLSPSQFGWDSGEICYPEVFEHRGQLYMLYNGTDFGKTGFGLAAYEK